MLRSARHTGFSGPSLGQTSIVHRARLRASEESAQGEPMVRPCAVFPTLSDVDGIVAFPSACLGHSGGLGIPASGGGMVSSG
jgi:hypothetical protein